MSMKAVTETDLREWLVKAQAFVREDYSRTFRDAIVDRAPVLAIHNVGKKYARIISQDPDGSGRSAYCFVDLGNGDILMSASWKAPAKHPRGNIFAENPVAGLTWTGAKYLR